MIDTIYIEESIAGHPRTKEILLRFPQATPISCSNYKEIFNPSGQNFRLQKKKPSLILAEKTGHLALPIPETYGIGGKRNFYSPICLTASMIVVTASYRECTPLLTTYSL